MARVGLMAKSAKPSAPATIAKSLTAREKVALFCAASDCSTFRDERSLSPRVLFPPPQRLGVGRDGLRTGRPRSAAIYPRQPLVRLCAIFAWQAKSHWLSFQTDQASQLVRRGKQTKMEDHSGRGRQMGIFIDQAR